MHPQQNVKTSKETKFFIPYKSLLIFLILAQPAPLMVSETVSKIRFNTWNNALSYVWNNIQNEKYFSYHSGQQLLLIILLKFGNLNLGMIVKFGGCFKSWAFYVEIRFHSLCAISTKKRWRQFLFWVINSTKKKIRSVQRRWLSRPRFVFTRDFRTAAP